MSIYALKPAFQAVLSPLLGYLTQWNVTANQLTIAALILCASHGLWIFVDPDALWPLLLLPLTVVLRLALNALDGMLARYQQRQTAVGAVLNELGDVLSDGLLYLPLGLIATVAAPLLVATVVLGLVVEMAGVAAIAAGMDRRHDGPFGKSDRALLFAFLGLWLGSGGAASGATGLLAIGLLLGIITVARRFMAVVRETQS